MGVLSPFVKKKEGVVKKETPSPPEKKKSKVKNVEENSNVKITKGKSESSEKKPRKVKEIHKDEKINPWEIITKYMELVRDKNTKVEQIRELFQPILNTTPSQLGFIVYCVNKYLLYNEPTRIMLEQLIRMSRQFEPMDYLITYFLFCKSHKCYFPKWMPFYYTNMNPFKSFVMENAKLTEEEFKIFCKRHEDKTMRDLAYLIKEIY